jgi:hypothetical protein
MKVNLKMITENNSSKEAAWQPKPVKDPKTLAYQLQNFYPR